MSDNNMVYDGTNPLQFSEEEKVTYKDLVGYMEKAYQLTGDLMNAFTTVKYIFSVCPYGLVVFNNYTNDPLFHFTYYEDPSDSEVSVAIYDFEDCDIPYDYFVLKEDASYTEDGDNEIDELFAEIYDELADFVDTYTDDTHIIRFEKRFDFHKTNDGALAFSFEYVPKGNVKKYTYEDYNIMQTLLRFDMDCIFNGTEQDGEIAMQIHPKITKEKIKEELDGIPTIQTDEK